MALEAVFFMPHPPLAVPVIGGGNERRIQNTLDGFERISKSIEAIKPDRIIFITPHGNAFKDTVVMLYEEDVEGDFGLFGYPEVKAKKNVDMAMTKALHKSLSDVGLPTLLLNHEVANKYDIHVTLDHGVLVPLHYIDSRYSNYKIVHLTSSFSSAKNHYKMGEIIAQVLDASEDKTIIIASGDLSHALKEDGPYTYNPYGEVFDALVVEAIKSTDPSGLLSLDSKSVEAAAQCGLRSFCLGFGAMSKKAYSGQVFSYEGPYGVGYLTGELLPKE